MDLDHCIMAVSVWAVTPVEIFRFSVVFIVVQFCVNYCARMMDLVRHYCMFCIKLTILMHQVVITTASNQFGS